MSQAQSGSCLCGGVTYTVSAVTRGVMTCHCKQCQRTSGNYVAATAALKEHVQITDAENILKWHKSSERAERAFCGICGSNMFWREFDGDSISIHAGTLDGPTGMKTETHIYFYDKADYYDEPCGSTGVDAPKFKTYKQVMTKSGACLCGAISYTFSDFSDEGLYCHCKQCQKSSGHYAAAAPVLNTDFKLVGSPKWFQSSETAKRGFCSTCGSNLFWQEQGADHIYLMLGSLNVTSDLKIRNHIFHASKADYYDAACVTNGLEKEIFDGWN